MRCSGKTHSERVRSDALIAQNLCRSNTDGYNPRRCKQIADAVCTHLKTLVAYLWAADNQVYHDL